MATDPDGDSQMASSPETNHSQSDNEEMQPGTRTPTQNTQNRTAQFTGVSELSPPGSQSQGLSGIPNISKDFPNRGGAAADSQQPGASWMNKRAEEEYQRAMEYVIDQDFSLDEFGDPFDDREMEEKIR
ncbi:hypothetical protein BJX99DRAFT_58361 [Aspergillus californicus]